MKAFFLSLSILVNICIGQINQHADTTFSESHKIESITYTTNVLRDSTAYYSKKGQKNKTFIYKGIGSEGIWILYDSIGNKTSKYRVNNNKRNGLATFYKTGKITSEYTYENNLLEGKALLYYEDGKIRWQGSYRKNKIDGPSIHYYKNGNLQWVGTYKEGKMDGQRLCYTESGSLTNGAFKILDEDGTIEKEGTCINGKPEGLVKQYNSKGVLVKEINFKDGKPNGPTHYYKEGKIVSMELFKNGKFKKEIKKEGIK